MGLLVLVCLALGGLVSYLYRTPLGTWLYATALALVVLGVAAVWDYTRLRRRHKELLRAAVSPEDCADALPTANGLLEQDYQALIRAMETDRRQVEERTAAEHADRLDYYTLWAHQIKTPISAMRLALQKEDSAFSRQVGLELGRIERYVEMALTYLRLDAGSGDYVIRPCALDPLLRGVLRKFSGEFIARRLRLDYQPVEQTVLTDEKWLSFAVEQLLSNALKYTPEGTISVYLEEPYILCIKDTGIGIAPEDLPRIFEKGYTGYNGREDLRASGIGLYLTRRVCQNLGHRVWAESTLGEGTTLRIDLERRELFRD